jgi:hypothetical protein
MKRRLISQALVLSAACSTLFLTSCATTESRISQHPEKYQRLSPSDQALVTEGRIRNGMSQDAVYLAWGGPDQRIEGRVQGKPSDTWIYVGTSYYPYPYGWGPAFNHGYGFGYLGHHRSPYHRYGYHGFYEPFFDAYRPSIYYPERTVSFQNGRVVAYQFLNSPRIY